MRSGPSLSVNKLLGVSCTCCCCCAPFGRSRREDDRETQAQDARLCMERLQLCECRALQPAARWYRTDLFFLDHFSISFGLSSYSSPLSLEESGIVAPHVVMCHLYLHQGEGYAWVRSASYPGSGTMLNSMEVTNQFYVALSEAHGKNAVSGLACACAVRVRLLDGESQVRVRGGPARGSRR